MVLIISKSNEASTDKVLDWLHYKGSTFCRVNGEDLLSHGSRMSFEIGNDELSFNLNQSKNINVETITSVWYRRDGACRLPANFLAGISKETFYKDIIRNLDQEYTAGKKGLYACITYNKKLLGNFQMPSPNKIEALTIAKKHGIDIPATLVTDAKPDLDAFIKRHGSVITKSLWEAIAFSGKNNSSPGKGNGFPAGQIEEYSKFTEEITPEIFGSIPDTFFYSLFQEKLDKEIDIRVFFLDGRCYSMAIFSQMDSKTKVDFRKYTNNRNVPYQLPEMLETRIGGLMKELGYNTGSLDIVRTKNGRLVFLEVNPVGQYGMTSMPCNYRLDKKIAEFLIHNEHEQQ